MFDMNNVLYVKFANREKLNKAYFLSQNIDKNISQSINLLLI